MLVVKVGTDTDGSQPWILEVVEAGAGKPAAEVVAPSRQRCGRHTGCVQCGTATAAAVAAMAAAAVAAAAALPPRLSMREAGGRSIISTNRSLVPRVTKVGKWESIVDVS